MFGDMDSKINVFSEYGECENCVQMSSNVCKSCSVCLLRDFCKGNGERSMKMCLWAEK